MKRLLPTLYSEPGTTLQLNSFEGYNPHPDGSPGRFVGMQNLTSKSYPLMKAGCSWRIGMPEGETSLIPRNFYKVFAFHGKLLTLEHILSEDTRLRYDGVEVGYIFGGRVTSIIPLGDKAYFFPAGYCFDRSDMTLTPLTSYWDNDIGGSGGTEVSYTLCDSEGVDYDYFAYDFFNFFPDYKYWLETGKTPHILNEYNYKLGVYVPIKETYIKITKNGNKNPADFTTLFYPGDTVEIIGSDMSGINKRTNVIKAVGKNYIVVPGMITISPPQNTLISIKTHIPKMKYVLLHKNRFWGVGAEGKEIFASSLGNPRSWYDYSNTAFGSYSASVGDGGEFVGGISFRGYIWFFKPDKVYKVIESNYPAVAIYEQPLPGAFFDSMAVIDNTLYYKSPRGIYAFDGERTTPIHQAIPEEYLSAPAPHGGGCDGRYFITLTRPSAPNTPTDSALFVYDTTKRVWHKESLGKTDTGEEYFAVSFTKIEDRLYYIRFPGSVRPIEYIKPSDTSITAGHRQRLSPVWHGSTGDFLSKSARQVYIREISIVYEGSFGVAVRYDSAGEYIPLGEAPHSSVKTCKKFLPVPRRCRHFSLRFSGESDCTVFSVSVITSKG